MGYFIVFCLVSLSSCILKNKNSLEIKGKLDKSIPLRVKAGSILCLARFKSESVPYPIQVSCSLQLNFLQQILDQERYTLFSYFMNTSYRQNVFGLFSSTLIWRVLNTRDN